MKHFLITRFNLRVSNWKMSRKDTPIVDEEWLSERFDLFENYCLPSVMNQSNQDFLWLVLFDVTTPDRYRVKIDKYRKRCAMFHPVFLDGADGLHEAVKSTVAESNPSSDESIITSRLDNDDMIHRSFIQTIQDLAQPNSKMLIDLRKGYRMNLEGKAIKIKKKYGPFLNLVEPYENFETIWARPHGDWRHETLEVKSVESERLWMQVIHGKNVSNSIPLFWPKVWKMNYSDFGIEKP